MDGLLWDLFRIAWFVLMMLGFVVFVLWVLHNEKRSAPSRDSGAREAKHSTAE